MNRQRIKAVSLWSLQRTANAVMTALRSMTDPMASSLKEVYTNDQLQPGLYAALPLTPVV
jgi:distribution and morphology protein 31